MPSVSRNQQSAFGIALAAKEGKIPKEQLRGASLHLFKTMSADQLREYASTPTKSLPKHKGRRHHVRAKVT